eukprot:COSAG02_NODE_13453_length_1393_cov_1.301391_2_plen_66_part_01
MNRELNLESLVTRSAMSEKPTTSSPSSCSHASVGGNQAAVSSARFRSVSLLRSASQYGADIKRRAS